MIEPDCQRSKCEPPGFLSDLLIVLIETYVLGLVRQVNSSPNVRQSKLYGLDLASSVSNKENQLYEPADAQPAPITDQDVSWCTSSLLQPSTPRLTPLSTAEQIIPFLRTGSEPKSAF